VDALYNEVADARADYYIAEKAGKALARIVEEVNNRT